MHSPLPWKLECGVLVASNNDAVIPGGVFNYELRPEVTCANAALILTAVNNFDAMRDAIKYHMEHCPACGNHHECISCNNFTEILKEIGD